jgi:hypothetical protein
MNTISRPLILVRPLPGGEVHYNIVPQPGYDSAPIIGTILCDLVRHWSHCFNVSEKELWGWIEHERTHPSGNSKPMTFLPKR